MSQPLVELLSSANDDARYRGISLLSSILLTDPTSIFNEFDSFYPFFKSLMENRANDSISFYMFNDLLYTAILASKIKKPKLSLITYIAECIASQNLPGRINAFVSGMVGIQNFEVPLLSMISTPITDKNIYSPLVKVLYSTESENILKLLSADTEKFANFISTSSDEDLTSIMKLVFSPNTAISNFCLSVALKVVQLNPSISEKLFSYAGPILTMPNYESNKDAVKLHRLLLSSKGGSEVQKVPELYKNLARLVFEQKTFETVDPKGTKKFLTVQQTPRKTTVLKARRSTLSMRLDEASIGQYLAQSESDSLIEIKPTVIKPLKGFATKKRSGGLHASSGKKWFEFYPHNKCLVWRAEQTQDGIKGILFLDNSVCIDKSGNVLSIKLKDKTIQIQFENRKTLNEWYSAISTCTRSQ